MSKTDDAEDVPDGFYYFTDSDHEVSEIIDSYEQDGETIRLVATYREVAQEWTCRKQVKRDGEWRTSAWGIGLDRNGPDDHPERVDYLGRYVRRESGILSDVSVLQRFVWAVGLFIECLRGMDVNLQYLHDPEWDPDEE